MNDLDYFLWWMLNTKKGNKVLYSTKFWFKVRKKRTTTQGR